MLESTRAARPVRVMPLWGVATSSALCSAPGSLVAVGQAPGGEREAWGGGGAGRGGREGSRQPKAAGGSNVCIQGWRWHAQRLGARATQPPRPASRTVERQGEVAGRLAHALGLNAQPQGPGHGAAELHRRLGDRQPHEAALLGVGRGSERRKEREAEEGRRARHGWWSEVRRDNALISKL
jgi:hypothetical protein